MKTLKAVTLWTFAIALIELSSCGKREGEPMIETMLDQEVATEIMAEFIDDDIEKLVLFHFFSLYELFYEEGGGVIETHILPNPYLNRNDCATITLNEAAGTLIIDFGVGCEGPNGIFRSGKIIVLFSEKENGLVENISVDLEDYAVENIQVEGRRTLVNNINANFPYSDITANIYQGRLTFSNNSVYCYESERHIHNQVLSEQDDEFSNGIAVNKSGINRQGEEFIFESGSSLRYYSVCFETGIGQATSAYFQLATTNTSKKIEISSENCIPTTRVTLGDDTKYYVDLSSLSIN